MKINNSGQKDRTYQFKGKGNEDKNRTEIKDSLVLSRENTEESLYRAGDKIKNLFVKTGFSKGPAQRDGDCETLQEIGRNEPLPVPETAYTGAEAQMAAQLEAYLEKILIDPQAEAEMIKMIASLNAAGKLRPVLQAVAATAVESGSLPPIPEKKIIEMVNQFADMIDAELSSHGMTPETHGKVYKDWETMAKEHLSMMRNSKVPPRKPGEPSCFTDSDFLKELETLQGASFQDGNSITPLIDGPASFSERNRLIDSATKSIHMMTWAFYDDETGWETAKKLVARHHDGLDVQVVVDGQVGSREHHSETLKYMEENGVKVIKWRNPEEPYQGQHRKLLIVDGESAIAGGLNPGNFYSHMGPSDGAKWRDTDVLLTGPAVADCEKLFSSVTGTEAEPHIPAVTGSARVASVNHVPGVDANIMLATMKAIQGASGLIDIENAYFIQTPGIKQVLLDALARGVDVRIFTNSAESVDEQIVSAPILRSLPEFVEAGAEVYLKKGDTLHSKFMVIDGMYSSIGSYNLHPRSERYEGEMTLNILDTETASNLTEAFEKDIAQAIRVTTSEQIKVPDNIMTIIPARYFFDQL
ncbi:MAG TPA: phosphatidylserine/phosphatidylglycerophosphate/cardiolipin synthase family protein [Candidatus Eremiobacteraeota bacterium]|nr:MAG: Major cardiolipin synthase ClsA [bacterium ADurb.Bin363]HPZ09097.1 phosphatidylserine/phosphatidylglycerophosphate/cardiolipin synthase family protein [Candidatus Eremiobacteraeota bacterium]